MSNESRSNEAGWERSVLEKLAFDAIKEQRRRRRWGLIFKALTFLYVAVIIAMWWPVIHGDKGTKAGASKTSHTALIQLEGAIGAGTPASADNIIEALNAAFNDSNTKGIILRINSPGGSPVQSGMIYDEIRRLRAKYPNTPLYAVVEDICASGGYYVAAAADKVFVDKASIVGSIGVRMDGFGFTETMKKVGVERRLITAGENKGFLDPFSPESPTQTEFAKKMLGEIHQQFIDVVRQGRGKRLKESPEMFSGLFWSGAKSIEMGLSDGYGTVASVARDVIKEENVEDYTQHENFAERFAKRFGASVFAGFDNRVNSPNWR